MARNGRFVFSRALLERAASLSAAGPDMPLAKARRRGTTVRLVDADGTTIGVIPSSRVRAGRPGELVLEIGRDDDRLAGLVQDAADVAAAPHASFEEASDFVFEEYGEALKRLANA